MKKINILIAEDSVEWMNFHLETFDKYFDDIDKEISISYSAKDAFIKVLSSSINFDLIITDLEMEKVSEEIYAGQWLLNNIQKLAQCKNTKFLIISGAPDISDVAVNFEVACIPKENYINNRNILRYKFSELFDTQEY
jgi:hypothetical protein